MISKMLLLLLLLRNWAEDVQQLMSMRILDRCRTDHHHLNSWESKGPTPPMPPALGDYLNTIVPLGPQLEDQVALWGCILFFIHISVMVKKPRLLDGNSRNPKITFFFVDSYYYWVDEFISYEMGHNGSLD